MLPSIIALMVPREAPVMGNYDCLAMAGCRYLYWP